MRKAWQAAQPAQPAERRLAFELWKCRRGRLWAAGARKPGGWPWEGARPGGGGIKGRTCVRAPRPALRSPDLAVII